MASPGDEGDLGFELIQLLLRNVLLPVARNHLRLTREHCCHGKALKLLLVDTENATDGLRGLDHERQRIALIAIADGERNAYPFRRLSFLTFGGRSPSDLI